MDFDRSSVQKKVSDLASRFIYIGTSSWKYRGWCGSLYDEARYLWRRRFAENRFDRNCLAEYAQVFKTVCVDAAYYTFPTEKSLVNLASQVPPDFRFGLKATDDITIRRFPTLPRFAERGGTINPDSLNADLFAKSFLKPCEGIKEKIGVIIFEFSRFYSGDYKHGSHFVTDLDQFLQRLPPSWPFAVEIRNKLWLTDEYFDCLRRHGVCHVYNSWEAMPSVTEQMAMRKSQTNPELVTARFQLKPGRKYEDAVKAFQPYERTGEVLPEARKAGRELIQQALRRQGGKTFLFINNRLEGNALNTIAAMVD
jgi:uncharacterized protein YecE (DUF72 family)